MQLLNDFTDAVLGPETVTASSATIMLGQDRTKLWFLRANVWPLLRDAASAAEPQHNDDPAAGRVVSFPAGTVSMRRTEMIRLAERIGDANTVGMLEDLAGRTPCRRTREASRLGAQALRDLLAGTRTEVLG